MESFFFSSRRRHTRLTCDWSSDVCSSDLGIWSKLCGGGGEGMDHSSVRASQGSEERRVGKECRSRWRAYHLKKKKLDSLGDMLHAALDCKSFAGRGRHHAVHVCLTHTLS